MRNGRVVEQGTHDALMQTESFYRDLYRAQFESEQ
jgi:ABC-type multidrug transport system fused ATPase/permease subunit